MAIAKLRKPRRRLDSLAASVREVDPKLLLFMVDYDDTDPQWVRRGAKDRSHADAWLDGFSHGEIQCAGKNISERLSENDRCGNDRGLRHSRLFRSRQ